MYQAIVAHQGLRSDLRLRIPELFSQLQIRNELEEEEEEEETKNTIDLLPTFVSLKSLIRMY